MEPNGHFTRKLEMIEEGVSEIKKDLAQSIDALTNAVKNLSAEFDRFVYVAQNSLPIRAVYALMAIMVIGLIGVEGVKNIGPVLKFWIGMP